MDAHKLLAAQRLLALLLLAWFAGRVVVVRHPPGAPAMSPPLRHYANVVVLGFLALAGAHVFWSLFATELPEYRHAERYDARAWQLGSPRDRRAVADRNGELLIATETGPDGVHRAYPLGAAAAHVTGYFHRKFGKTGIEGACDQQLVNWREPAWETLRPDRLPAADPPALRLTIDADLQRAAAKGLGRRTGAVVVLNPATGEVLALVSSPSFDPARIDEATFHRWLGDPTSPLLDRALHGLYPPGSTFKPVTATAALQAGIPPETVHATPPEGYLPPYDDRRIKDFEAGETLPDHQVWQGHGPLDLPEALARSANGYFAWLGVQVGADPLRHAAEQYGLSRGWPLARGHGRADDLRSLSGKLPSGHLKPGRVARLAIGQDELLVTPLGMALVAAEIANYGRLVPPRLVLDDPVGAARQVVPAETAAQLVALLRQPVERRHGTARSLRRAGVPVAAKTGSAENPHGAAHGWVIAFAPAERATLALAVLVENGGTGGASAVPVARRLLTAADAAGYFDVGGGRQ